MQAEDSPPDAKMNRVAAARRPMILANENILADASDAEVVV